MDDLTISGDINVVASKQQVSTELQGEAVILNFDEGVYYGLDAVGAKVWELLQESRTVGEIRDHLVGAYAVEPDRCEADLRELLSELAHAGLVEVGGADPS